MGQQQLLLVILVTILVGIATVVALSVFGSSNRNANVDAVRQDMLTIAASAQGWYIKPEMMGGGNSSFDGSTTTAGVGMTFKDISFPADSIYAGDKIASNMNGTYEIVSESANNFVLKGTPATNTNYVAGTSGSTAGTANGYLEVSVFNQKLGTWTDATK